jgi:hypothetical protein
MSVIVLNQESFKRNMEGIENFSSKFNYGRIILISEQKKNFNELYHLNIRSWNEAYGEHKQEIENINYNNITITDEHKNIYSLLKSLQCLQYQIDYTPTCRHLSYNERNALQFLYDIIDRITSYIISESEEYKSSDWK